MKVSSYKQLRDLVLQDDSFERGLFKRLVILWNSSEEDSEGRALVATIIKNKELESYKMPPRLEKKLRKLEGKKRGRGFEKKEPRNWLQS